MYFCMEVDFWDLCSLISATKCLNLFVGSQSLSLSRFGGQRSKNVEREQLGGGQIYDHPVR